MTEVTKTLTLQEFLEARWAEDEAVAQGAPGGDWFSALETGDDAENFGSIYTSASKSWTDAETVADWYMPGAGEHIARHDPASVLAATAAKRAILALHKPQWNDTADIDADFYGCLTCAESDLCATVKHLASPYSDHPDYREEWKL